MRARDLAWILLLLEERGSPPGVSGRAGPVTPSPPPLSTATPREKVPMVLSTGDTPVSGSKELLRWYGPGSLDELIIESKEGDTYELMVEDAGRIVLDQSLSELESIGKTSNFVTVVLGSDGYKRLQLGPLPFVGDLRVVVRGSITLHRVFARGWVYS